MRNLIRAAMRRVGRVILGQPGDTLEHDCHAANQVAQRQLYLTYREMAAAGRVPSLSEVGFRCFSQFEEDGILLFIFAVIGTTNRTVVEVCAGDGTECMSANLIVNHGWWGHLFDGSEANVERGRRFFHDTRDTFLFPPQFTHAWITRENVNERITASGAQGEIDLLALDVDGMDYWIWDAISCIRPRVVVCETHNAIGAADALTVAYDPNFVIDTPDHFGASLAAMTKLADAKGYRLIGTHRYGFNAFFVLKELAGDLLPTVTPAECLRDPYSRAAQLTRWPRVRDLKWERV